MRTDILIADSVGDDLTSAFRRILPHLEMRGHTMPGTPPGPVHNHGAWCGYLAGIPLERRSVVQDVPGRMDFVRIFDSNGKNLQGGLEFLLEKIAELRPRVVSRSWGAWDGDDPFAELLLPELYKQFVADFTALQKEIGFLDFASAGNNDRNDLDNDIAFPQRLMPETFIIGSTNRTGIPSVFSGDGSQGTVVCVGEKVLSPGLDGAWDAWNGTSATCPKMAGVAAAGDFTSESFMQHLKEQASWPVGYERPHPKWFWGNTEELWQAHARMVTDASWPAPDFDLRLDHAHKVYG